MSLFKSSLLLKKTAKTENSCFNFATQKLNKNNL